MVMSGRGLETVPDWLDFSSAFAVDFGLADRVVSWDRVAGL
jgi:hypothetical protein